MSESHKKAPTDRRPFQFSIRSLLILTAVVAVLLKVGVTLHQRQLAAERPWLLIQAIQSGDIEEVDRILKIDPKLAHGRKHGGAHTPLQEALAFSRNPKVLDRVLREKPDPNETSGDGQTALHVAVVHCPASELTRLLELGADPNAVDDRGRVPLHLAARRNEEGELTKLLLEAGADPNIVDNEGLTPLHIAAHRNARLTELLLEGGADPNKVNPNHPQGDGKSPLHIAAERCNERAVKHLVDAGALINATDQEGRTPLHLAISWDHRKIADLLLEHGADLKAKDNAGLIPGRWSDGSNSETAALMWWDRIGQLHEQEKIDELDATLDAFPEILSLRAGYSPTTLLHWAVVYKRGELADYLLKRGMDPNVLGMNGRTPLHSVSSVDCAERLLAAGADIETKDGSGKTPLHQVARRGDHDVLQLLLEKGADVKVLDDAGTSVIDNMFERQIDPASDRKTLDALRQAGHAPTVLYAAVTADVDLLQELARDDPESLDRAYTRNGVRPLHAAVLSRQTGIVRWLLDRGVSRDPRSPADQKGMPIDTPLLLALSYNTVDIAMLLIDRGADVNCQGRHGCYPAHAVIDWDRDPKILEALLAQGADPTLTYRKKTAVELATKSRSKKRKRYLELLGVPKD